MGAVCSGSAATQASSPGPTAAQDSPAGAGPEPKVVSYPFVCLGGGVAAGYLAKELATVGKLGTDALCIGEEPVVSYERPALSKAYLAPSGAARLPGFHTCVGGGGERQEPGWYEQRGITFLTGAKVTAVDLESKTLTLASGKTIYFGKLVIATGARATHLSDVGTPGAELSGAHYLRSEADAAKLVKAIAETKARGGKAVVVGGGYIGMEVAAALCINGLQPTLVSPDPHLMPRLFNPAIAGFYERFYADKGVTLLKGGRLTALEGARGKVTHVVVDVKGEAVRLPADLVVVGIGARANTELFTSQLEMAAGGIKVDERLRTSEPDVYAIGDVATFPLMMEGGALGRQEHVVNARLMAAHVAKELTGTSTSGYDYLPYFYSRVFSLSWQFYGSSAGAECVVFGDMQEAKFGAYFVRDGKVVGAFLESGSAEEVDAIKRVARARPTAPPSAELAQLGVSFALQLASKM